jgi:colicin import membrane protein
MAVLAAVLLSGCAGEPPKLAPAPEEAVSAQQDAQPPDPRATWALAIIRRIRHSWAMPPSAAGTRCVLQVTQDSAGQVVNARISDCNGDDAVRESLLAAVHRASPLPPPPEPALFDPNLTIVFAP